MANPEPAQPAVVPDGCGAARRLSQQAPAPALPRWGYRAVMLIFDHTIDRYVAEWFTVTAEAYDAGVA